MTPSFYVAMLFQMCQEGKINWVSTSEGGLVTQSNGIDARIIGGGETSWIFLSVSSGFKSWSIREPLPHISEAPIGKFISWVRKRVGLPPIKGPQKDLDKINSEIKTNLIAIRNFALDQVVKKYEKGHGYDEEMQELFQQFVYGEAIKQR